MNLNSNSKITQNKVKNRFLFLAPSVEAGLEAEAKFSDFEMKQLLGEGSFGKVYLVKHKKTAATYAIKAIDKRNKNNQEGKPYFSREIEIMYKVAHPNIVRLYTHFEDDDYCYFVMEYIGKGNLYDVLRKEKALSASSVANYMKDVISAVYYLHHMVPIIIHRDIKPENVLLHTDGKVKLTDFGWSNYTNDNEIRDTYCGTPVYLAPEMILGIGHDDRLDVWCIGVLMFELLTGRPPFLGNNIKELNENIKNLRINWPKDINLDSKNLITKILRYNPNDRISLEEMLKHPFFTKNVNLISLNELLIKPNDVESDNKIYLLSEHLPQDFGTEKIKNKKKLTEKVMQAKSSSSSIETNSKVITAQVSNEAYLNLILQNEHLKKDFEKLNNELNDLKTQKLTNTNNNQSNFDKQSTSKEDILNIEAIFIKQKQNLEKELEEKDNEKFHLQNINAELNSKIKDQENLLRETKETLRFTEDKKQKSEKESLKLITQLNKLKLEKDDLTKNYENKIYELEETIANYKNMSQNIVKPEGDIHANCIKQIEKELNKEKEKYSMQLKYKDDQIKKLTEEKIQIKENEFKKFENILNKTELQLKLKESEVENLKVKIVKLENIITVNKNAMK